MLMILTNITSFLSRYISGVILLFSIFAFLWPHYFSWMVDYTAIFLAVAMFGMGLTIKTEDFKVVFARPKEVLLGCVLQYSIMPILAWLLSYSLQLPSDIAIGVILLGCCPGGVASNVITYIAKGDVPLSVGMTIVSTLLAPLLMPILVYSLGGMWVSVPVEAMLYSIVKIVLLPIFLGIFLHSIFYNYIQKFKPFLPLMSISSIVLIISGIIAVNGEKIIESGILVLVVVVLHNLLGLGLSLLIANYLGIAYHKATALAVEVSMQNSGLAVSLSAVHFAANPLATLPGAIFSVWHNLSGSVFANVRSRTMSKKEISHSSYCETV